MDTTVGTALQQRTTYMNNSISTHVPENRKYATSKPTVRVQSKYYPGTYTVAEHAIA